TKFHSRTKEMVNALSRFRGRMAVPESSDGSAVSRRLDACRPRGSSRSSVGAWTDRIPHVPPHLPCLAGRNGSTRGRAAETHAACTHFYDNGPVWQRLDHGQTPGKPADCGTPVNEVRQPAGRGSIKKGNRGSVLLIGQFWTVARNDRSSVTL